ncbi:MAG: GTP-binding protein [Bacteroidia bacterium]|nr:GTP-binding protein [Bacteroidia bacterium]
MELGKEIKLRPRFKIELQCDDEEALQTLERVQQFTSDFSIKRVDHHVFIGFPKEKQHYWSPQLDLEILSFEEGKCELHGLFGPKPAVWTLFMFLHFVVATLFIGFGIWAYTNHSLEQNYGVQLLLTGLTVIAWFVLYFAGRMGKLAGKEEMKILYRFMKDTLKI